MLTHQSEIRDFISNSDMLPSPTSENPNPPVTFSHVVNVLNHSDSDMSPFRQENVTVRFVPMDKHQGLANFTVLLSACERFCTA
jgi:hypothetical protein